VGTGACVVVEGDGFGRSEHDAPVEFPGCGAVPGSVIAMRIVASTGTALAGEP
jgi:hypothetical protein